MSACFGHFLFDSKPFERAVCGDNCYLSLVNPLAHLQELSSLFPSFSIRVQQIPDRLFLPGNNTVYELTRQGTQIQPSTVPCSLPVTSRIHLSLFSDRTRCVSSKFFDTQLPSVSTEELVFSRHAGYVLYPFRCNGHNLRLNFDL